jgi:uncharacterized membrane protein YbhN (UPF0104 family)
MAYVLQQRVNRIPVFERCLWLHFILASQIVYRLTCCECNREKYLSYIDLRYDSTMKMRYARFSITLIFWGIIFYLLRRSFQSMPTIDELSSAISDNADPTLLALGGGLFFCAMLARFSRFHFMMNSIVPLAKSDAAAIFFWSFFLGAISPFRAGESVRILWARQHGVDVTAAAAIWIAERCADLYTITAISLCAAMMVFNHIQIGSGIALGGGLLALPLLVIFYLLSGRTIIKVPFLKKLPSAVISKIDFMRGNGFLVGFALLTFLIWLLMGLTFYVSYSAFVDNLSLHGAALVMGLVNLSFLLAFLPGNLVGYQSTAIFALGLLGVAPTIGLAASIVVYAITFLVILVLGTVSRARLAVS